MGPERAWANGQRLRGLDLASSLGIEVIRLPTAAPRFEGGEAVVEAVLDAGVTAVIAYNDLVALGLLSGLRARGVPVPKAVSVVGFDDIFAARMVSPALTTVAMPSDEAGRQAVGLLARRLSALDGRNRRVTIPTSLVIRDSTGVAAGASPGRSPPIVAGDEARPRGGRTRRADHVNGFRSTVDGEEQIR